MKDITERFLEYVSYDSQSNPDSISFPSSAKQLVLLEHLRDELEQMGIPATIDQNGYVMGKIPSNCRKQLPAVGFIAHVDTSPDAPGNNIKPQIIENYDGGNIVLQGSGAVLSADDYPSLNSYIGQTIITTDGTTLLGADDKAGVAEIMQAAQYIMEHPEFKHGPVCIAFTPDEEIGRGVDHFNVQQFGADFAYTVDGGAIGELEYENFNAASAKVHFKGFNIHPGYAKGKMKNALRMAVLFDSLLPEGCRPEETEGYEGFFHLVHCEGNVDEASLTYIIRDHDKNLFERKKRIMQESAEAVCRKFGEKCADVEFQDQYYNMRSRIEPHFHIIDIARKAMLEEGITAHTKPIRGGTDGARLSYMGLPCPNIFAGGHNFHSKLEFIPIESMKKAFKVIVKIISLFTEE